MITCPKCKSSNVKKIGFKELLNEGMGSYRVIVATAEYRCNMCKRRFTVKTQL